MASCSGDWGTRRILGNPSILLLVATFASTSGMRIAEDSHEIDAYEESMEAWRAVARHQMQLGFRSHDEEDGERTEAAVGLDARQRKSAVMNSSKTSVSSGRDLASVLDDALARKGSRDDEDAKDTDLVRGASQKISPSNLLKKVFGSATKRPNFHFKKMPAPGAKIENTVITADVTVNRMVFEMYGGDVQEATFSSSNQIDITLVLFVSPKSGGRVGSKLLSFGQGLDVGRVRELTFELLHGNRRVYTFSQRCFNPLGCKKDLKGLKSSVVQALFFQITDTCSRSAGKYAIRVIRNESNIVMENADECAEAKVDIDRILHRYTYAKDRENKDLVDVRSIAAGGDGTIFWLVDELYKVAQPPIPVPVGAIPFGTGNDLSRQLNTPAGSAVCSGAGGADDLADSGSIVGLKGTLEVLTKFALAPRSRFDVWTAVVDTFAGGNIQIVDDGKLKTLDRGCERSVEGRCEKLSMTLGNYGSTGFESLIGLEFEEWRSTRKNNSQLRNKAKYAEIGFKYSAYRKESKVFRDSNLKNQPLKEYLEDVHDDPAPLDGGEDEVSSFGCDPSKDGFQGSYKSMVFMNVECIMGGKRKWPKAKQIPAQPAYDDDLIEALSFQSPTNMLADGVLQGVCAIGQYAGPVVDFKPNHAAAFQIDGEFFAAKDPKQMKITKREQVYMLRLGKGHDGIVGSPSILFNS